MPRAFIRALAITTALAAHACDGVAADPAPLAVRPAFAAPFNAAQDLIKAGRGAEALAKLKEAEALGNLSPYERYLLLRVRAPAEYANGDLPAAAADFDAVLASDQLPAADRLPLLSNRAQILYTTKDYPQAAVAIQRYLDAGGQDAQLRELLPQALYMSKDYSKAAKDFKAQVDALTAAGQKPADKTLRLLASSQQQAGDDAGYVVTLERLAVTYPRLEYWKELIARAVRTDKFPDRLALDVYRLQAAALGDVADDNRLPYAALSLHLGYPAEALRVLDAGLAKTAFSGTDLTDATRLREQVARSAALDKAQGAANETEAASSRDGNALVSVGLLDALAGDPTHGIALLQQGIAKGGLKSPDDARLHLGVAQWLAALDPDALQTFQSLQSAGADPGVSALAHVWALLVQSRRSREAKSPA